MGLFSGLQIAGILCSIVKLKLVALWLGAPGVGLFGIYQSVADNISTLTDLGLRQSAVRDVAQCNNNPALLARIAYIVRRWSLFAALFGAVVVIGLAPLLGEWFFHSPGAVWGFLALGIALFFNAITGGEQALLQGSAQLRRLAKGNLIGTVSGLAVSIPMFYFWGLNSVAPSIAVYGITMYLATRRYRLLTSSPEPLGLKEIINKGKGFVRLGIYMALASFITSTAHTIFIGILNTLTDTATVGLVQAGDTLIVRYLGLIFTAIAMEFYPRIAAARTAHASQAYVNHEVVLLLLVLTPMLLLFISCRSIIVELLYSAEFTAIIPFITFGCLASIPKAISWCMAYMIVARGDGKAYIITEGLDALISVPLCLLAYNYFGMAGLGLAYIVWYLIYALIVGIVYYRRYGMRIKPDIWLLTSICAAACAGAIFAVENFLLWQAIAISAVIAGAFLFPLIKMIRR